MECDRRSRKRKASSDQRNPPKRSTNAPNMQPDVIDWITLVVDDLQYHVPRHAMVDCSQYFRALFTSGMWECDGNTVDLSFLTSTGVQAISTFAQTGQLDIRQDNVMDVLSAASYLQVDQAVGRCDGFLSRMISIENCFDIFDLTESHPLPRTHERIRRFIFRNFKKFASHADFNKLTCRQLAGLLEDDSLRIRSEYTLFTSVVEWVKHDVENRQKELASLMRHVRLPLLSAEELQQKVCEEELVTANKECLEMIKEARIYRVFVKEQPMLQTRQTQIRSGQQHIIVCEGSRLESINVVTSKCRSLKCLPAPMYNPCVCVVDNFMYVCGGMETPDGLDGRATTRCLRYDPRLNSWLRLPYMHRARSDFVLVALDKYLYAIGGQDGHVRTNTVERFSIKDCEWEMCPARLPDAVSMHAGVSLGNRIYISGGITWQGDQDTGLSYDPVIGGAWLEETKLLRKRSDHIMVEWKGRLLVFGGTVEEIESLHPSAGTWTSSESDLDIRAAGAAVVDDGVYIVGGVTGNNSHSCRIVTYLPDTDRLEFRVPDVPFTRGRACCTLTISKISTTDDL